MSDRLLLSVVDDDEFMRELLPDLLREFRYAARAFSPAEEFLTSADVEKTKCLILDIAMRGRSRLDLQRELVIRKREIPIIFITAHESIRPRALRHGAIE